MLQDPDSWRLREIPFNPSWSHMPLLGKSTPLTDLVYDTNTGCRPTKCKDHRIEITKLSEPFLYPGAAMWIFATARGH